MVTTGVLASISACKFRSWATLWRGWQVLPNAASLACFNFSSWARWKKAMSLAFEPGQPPSM